MADSINQNRICVGVVAGSHGLQGAVKIKSFMVEPSDIGAYGPLTDKNGARKFEIDLLSISEKNLIAKLSGVTDRNSSEAIKGLELFLTRDLLPKLDKDEFYYSDLVGLSVENTEGEVIGVVGSVDNFGAGEIMEVNMKDGAVELLHISRKVVPEIDLRNKRVVIDPPSEVFADKNHGGVKSKEK